MSLWGPSAKGEGERAQNWGSSPFTACQLWPPAFSSSPAESFLELHCFGSWIQDLEFCYTPAKLRGSYLQQIGKWAGPACGKAQCGPWWGCHPS